MERIAILRMGEFLLVTIQVDMHDRLAMTLQDDLTSMIEKTGARGVLIDISSLEVVDSGFQRRELLMMDLDQRQDCRLEFRRGAVPQWIRERRGCHYSKIVS